VSHLFDLPPVEAAPHPLPTWRLTELARFDVAGTPAPQGSKTVMKSAGRSWAVEGSSTPGRARLSAWRIAVAAEARRWAEGGHAPVDGPVALALTFRMPRVTGLLKTRYNFATKQPDFDKLTRAVSDGLTGIVWRNDAQVVHALVIKRYAEPDEAPGCAIVVGTLSAVGE
jgi:Holliday junction resolvase RusA-like endonuclease